MQTADIVIVGGGVMGTSIAYHLAKAGAGRVLLLEKRFVGAGASGKSGAILRQHYSHEVTARMALWSLRFFQRFPEETGCQAGYRRTGFLFAVPEAERAALEANVALQRSVGVDAAVLDAERLRELEPRAQWEGDLAAHEPDGGYVEPLSVLHGFSRRARELGAELREGATVRGFLRQGSRVTGVRTDEEEIHCGSVVLAAGPWSGALARACGLDLPLEVLRPSIAFLARPPEFGPAHPVVGDLRHGFYLRADAGERTWVGMVDVSGDPRVPDPDDYDEGVDAAFLKTAHALVTRRYPGLARAVRRGGYSGLYTVTPDYQALIDAAPGCEGLFLCTGFSGHGFKLSPAVGQAVADRLLGRESEAADLSLFRAERFSEGRLVKGRYEYGIVG